MAKRGLSTAAKVVGATFMAIGGVGVLVWAVVTTGCLGGEKVDLTPGEVSALTVEEAYARVGEAITRPGFVLHSTIEAVGPTEEGETAPVYTKEFWIDGERDALREQFRLDPQRLDDFEIDEEYVVIVAGPYIFSQDDPGEALRFEVEEFCPRTKDAVLSRLLECAAFSIPDFQLPLSRLDADALYKGRPAVALVLEEAETALRIYLDRETFLPLARVAEFDGDPDPATLVSEYRHEFVPQDDIPADLLDPRSIGYGAENEDALLDEIVREVPVYWLGSEFQPEGGFDPLVLVRIPRREERRNEGGQGIDDPGMSGWLVYDTPRGLSGVHILLWRRADWEAFLQSEMGSYLADPRCSTRLEPQLAGRQVTVYRAPELSYPLTVESLGPCAGRISFPILTTTTLIAVIDLGEVIVDVRPDPTGDYRSLEAMEAVIVGLRPR